MEAKEFCFWLVDPPITVEAATRAVRLGIPKGTRYLAEGAVEIVRSPKWFLRGGAFSLLPMDTRR